MNDMTEVKTLIEQSQKAFDEFKNANDANIAKRDAVTDEKIAKLNTYLDEIKTSIDQKMREISRPSLGGEGGEQKAEAVAYTQAFMDYFRKGIEAPNMHELAHKALSVGSNADGGYAVTPQMETAIDAVLKEISPMRSIATVMQISSGSYVKPVSQRGTASGWAAEAADRTETNASTLAQLTFSAAELYANPKATQALLDDSFVNIEQWVADEVATEFAYQEGKAFIDGNGTNKPKGILGYTNAADASYAWGGLGYIASGAAGAWAASNPSDALISLVHALKAGYRQNANFLMNRKTLGDIRKFKDSNGNYLWQPSLQAGAPSSLLGYGVVEAEDMPVVAANSYSLAFGDFRRGYLIVDRVGIRTLRDAYTAKPYVQFYTTKRVGGGVQNFEAIKLLKFAAS